VRTPTYAQLRRFCEVDGWTDLTKQGGRRRRHHLRYAKVLSGGRALYTRVSLGAGSIDDHGLFKHILRDQLEVTEEQFWVAVDNGVAPERPGARRSERPAGSYLDYSVVKGLLAAGYTEQQIAAMTKDEAVDLLDYFRAWGERKRADS
jgi:hypothetical protein